MNLLTAAQVAERLNLHRADGSPNVRAVYALPIKRTCASPRKTRWSEEDVLRFTGLKGPLSTTRLKPHAPPEQRPKSLSEKEILKLPGNAADLDPGIYFLLKGGRIMYVGRAKIPLCRVGEHARKRRFDAYVVVPCPLEYLVDVEAMYILELRPLWNKIGY